MKKKLVVRETGFMDFYLYERLFEEKNEIICFDKCAKWMFDILFEGEKDIKFFLYIYHQRVLGFIDKRLLSLYCYHNKLKIIILPYKRLKEQIL